MPNTTSQQSGILSATLVLDNALRLTGQLSSLLDGRLQLDAVRRLDDPDSTDVITVEPGSMATLSLLTAGDIPRPIEQATVGIVHQYAGGITLEFAAADRELAARYREAIAEYTSLLDALQQRSLAQLELLLTPFFTDLTDYLLDLSSRIRQREIGRHPHYEAWISVRRSRTEIKQLMLQQVTEYYADLTPEHIDDQLWRYDIHNVDELDLIDLQEFEDFLAIDRMVTLGEDLYKIPLEALTLRLATLIDVDPNTVRLPIHVRQLCRAFQRPLIAFDIPHEVLSHIFDYFAKHFIRKLGSFYDPLNTLLSENNVRPQVEVEIEANGSLLTRYQPKPRVLQRAPPANNGIDAATEIGREAERHTPAPGIPENTDNAALVANPAWNTFSQQPGEQPTTRLGQVNPARLYRSVVDALNFKREAEGLAGDSTLVAGRTASGTWEGATVASTALDQGKLADASSIAKVLSALQRDSQVRKDVRESDSLLSYLASHKNQIGGLQNTTGLTTDSLNQLDMVDNLFETIRSQLDVSSDIKPVLANLQIPLAKMALLDPQFFLDHSHSARAVVDKLSELATSANFPNKALEGRINNIVDDIIRDYETDNTVFDSALQRIDKLVAQQARALSLNINRVVRAQEGQQKLADARQTVDKVISTRVKPPSAPKVLVDLIDCGWRDLLVLTHIREGDDSPAWTEQIKTLDLLCLWLEEIQQGEVDDDLSLQRGMEAEPFIDLIGQQISSALPTNIAHEAVLEKLRDILAGRDAVESTPIRRDPSARKPEPAEVRARIEDLPRLRRWVKRVEQLEISSWLNYRDKSGGKKRMQLAWISPARDRYIFVNERGQKVADFSAVQVARQLSQGVQPPAPTDQFSVVDKSLYHTLEHVQKSLSFDRNHDSLTKLINRETFLGQMRRALSHSQLKHAQHSLLYLNIDQFKLVNKVFDRISGDQVLLEFAKLLAQLHGKKSSSSRIQSDEFAVLLLDEPIENAMQIAEKIRGDIEASPVEIAGENVSFTVSIGVTSILEHSPSVEEVMNAARSAMQHAKQSGRNRVVQFEEAQSRVSDYKLEKTRTLQDLESALASDRFILRAQPIVQTAFSDGGNTSLHYELLLGLVNKDGSLSSPQEFIDSAERYGFMTLVDRWVVREAFTWISQLMDAQKVVPRLAINLSGSSVTDDSFMEYLLEQISEFGVGTSRLCFEITETGTISNLVKAADFVRAFRNIGCKFSIDDFGTGLASHNYLRELPVDYVKIDGSFITGIHKNRSDYAMARSINDLAHFLGQETIAESVENDEIIVKLKELGVDYLQGWGVGKPKPLIEVSADLSNLEK